MISLLRLGNHVCTKSGIMSRLKTLARDVSKLTDESYCAVLLPDHYTRKFVTMATSRGWKCICDGKELSIKFDSATVCALSGNQPINIPDPATDPDIDDDLRSIGRNSSLAITAISDCKDIYGLIVLLRPKRSKGFTRSQMRLVKDVARFAVFFIHDANLIEQIEHAKQEWQTSFDSIREPILVVGNDGRISRSNLAASQFLKRDIRDIRNYTCHELIWKRDTPCDGCALLNPASKHTNRIEELSGRLGDEAFVEQYHPIVQTNNEVSGYIVHLSIVTEKKHIQEQMDKANRFAAIGELAAGVAHNFGNVLMGVSSTLDVLSMKLPALAGGEKLSGMVNGAQLQVSRGTEIIRRMLSLANGQSVDKSSAQLCEVVKNVIALASTYPLSKKAEFQVSVPADLPPLMVDPSELEEVLLNLVLNALQSLDKSGQVSISAQQSGKAGCIEVKIKDNGCGIAQDDLPRIFDPFYSRRHVGGTGTGLGLSTCLGLVTRMGGNIDVESVPGQGSTFTLVLPSAGQQKKAA